MSVRWVVIFQFVHEFFFFASYEKPDMKSCVASKTINPFTIYFFRKLYQMFNSLEEEHLLLMCG